MRLRRCYISALCNGDGAFLRTFAHLGPQVLADRRTEVPIGFDIIASGPVPWGSSVREFGHSHIQNGPSLKALSSYVHFPTIADLEKLGPYACQDKIQQRITKAICNRIQKRMHVASS
ncbi:hypothetical protein IWQ54_004993 [Labrenzia sp. EL_195]|nr:hypothetical protein [Labrenzia sp. EL_195]